MLFRPRPLIGGALAILAATFSGQAEAECSHRIMAAYTTPLAAEMLGARPELGMGSISEQIIALSGCSIAIASLPTARVWAEFEKGDLDLVFGATQTDERDSLADFIPTFRFPILLVTLKQPGAVPERLEDFGPRHLRVGLLRGARLSADAQAVIEDLRRQGLIDEATDREEAYRKLEGGRDDALLATVSPADRPERDSLRVMVQSQFSPMVNGTYLRRAGFTPRERQLLYDAIVKATSERDPSAGPH